MDPVPNKLELIATLERLAQQVQAALEQVRRMPGVPETALEDAEFLRILLDWVASRSKRAPLGSRYFLIWYAKEQFEQRHDSLAHLIRAQLTAPEARVLDAAMSKTWQEAGEGSESVRTRGRKLAREFEKSLSGVEKYKWRRYLKVLLPPSILLLGRRASAAQVGVAVVALVAVVAVVLRVRHVGSLPKDQATLTESQVRPSISAGPRPEIEPSAHPAADRAIGECSGSARVALTNECLLDQARTSRDQAAAKILYRRVIESSISGDQAELVVESGVIRSALSLSQSIHARFSPGTVPENVGVGWRSPERRDAIPARFVAQAQRVRALEALAALDATQRRYADAMVEYQDYVREKNAQPAWNALSGGPDVDCWILLALGIRAGTPPEKPMQCFDMVPNGPVTLGLLQYEFGIANERWGDKPTAVLNFASVLWQQRHALTDEERRTRAALLSASPWGGLFDLDKIVADADVRLRSLETRQAREHRIIIGDDFLVLTMWGERSRGGRLIVAFTDVKDRTCEPDLAERDKTMQAGTWKVTLELPNANVGRSNLDQHVQNVGWIDVAPLQRTGGMRLTAHLTLLNPSPHSDDCSDIERRVDLCLAPDGRLTVRSGNSCAD